MAHKQAGQKGGGNAPFRIQALTQTTDSLEDRLRGGLYRFRMPVFLLAVTILAFAGRISLWPFASADYNECLHVWLDEIRAGQGFRSIGTQIGNYTAPYHYLMAAMTYIPGLTNLAVVKITSSVADFCMAAAAAAVCLQLCRHKLKAAACYAICLCLPTVFLNSAAWGQCDAMYTTLVLLFIALYLANRKGWALFLYGCALAIKLQAIFVLPAILIFWLCGRLRVRHLLAGVLGYVVLFIPAMIGDGSMAPMFRAYAMQTNIQSLASNIPTGASLFTGFHAEELDMIGGMLIPAFAVAMGLIALYCWQKKDAFTPQSEFLLLALIAVLVPFLLPAMKDRYYFPIEVMTVVYALAWPRRLFAPVLMQLGSLPGYMWYLRGMDNYFGRWLVLVVGIVPLCLFWDLYRHLSVAKTRPANTA